MTHRRRRGIVVGLLVGMGVQGCGEQDCTRIGGVNAVSVELAASLASTPGDLVLEVCDDGTCASARQAVDERSLVMFSFDELGQDFAAGRVMVEVSLRRADGRLVAARRQHVILTRSYPNGKACDGDGFVNGSLELGVGDRV